MVYKKKMLNSLTGLRFFAAIAIVFFHIQGNFGLPLISRGFKLQQGVSFFFVLSGFILCYRYPRLNSAKQCYDFIVSRIARIWPAHLVTLLLSTGLLMGDGQDYPQFHNVWTFIANAFLVHAWIPLTEFFLPYNSVSWSISTELAFYILFPFFLLKIKRRPFVNLLASLLLAIGMIVASEWFDVPGFDANKFGVSVLGILYINPLARLFEFVLGMVACVLWREFSMHLPKSIGLGLLMEIPAILLVVFNSQLGVMAFASIGLHLDRHVSQWFASSGTVAIPAAILIIVFAQNAGPVSRCLSRPLFVFLGEISFSIYMVHQLVFRLFVKELSYFYDQPVLLQLFLYFFVTLISAHILWVFVEKPGRNFIRSAFSRGHDRGSEGKVDDGEAERGFLTLFTLKVELAFVLLLICVSFLIRGSGLVSESRASEVIEQSKSLVNGAEFGRKIRVVSAFYTPARNGYELSFLWQALEDISPDILLAIHISEENKVLSQASSIVRRAQPVKAGQFFLDRVPIKSAQLSKPASHVGIVFFGLTSGPLLISGALYDWEGHRLVLPLPSP